VVLVELVVALVELVVVLVELAVVLPISTDGWGTHWVGEVAVGITATVGGASSYRQLDICWN
jgi:hypothetical protein